MPSGIDAALAKMNQTGPEPTRISYNGFEPEKAKKPVVTEATIDPATEGLEKCQKIVKEQEFKIKKIQDKIAGMPPTKKMKPEIAKEKEKLQVLQYDGNYRAAMDFVRKHEEREREARRDAADKLDEASLVAGGLKSKKDKNAEVEAQAEKTKDSKKKDTKKSEALTPEAGPFECDTEVVAVVQSAVEGSAEAQAKLAAGLGVTKYASVVRAEECSMVHACSEKIQPKLKRVPTREHALRTIRALLWNPPAILPTYAAVLGLLDETKLKSEPGGKAVDLVTEMSKAGVSGKAMPKLVLPVLLDHMGAAAGGKWQVKVGTMGILKEVMKRMSEPDMCPKQLGLLMPKVMAAVRQAVGDARKEVKKEAEALLRHMGSTMAGTPEIQNLADDIIGSILDSANMERAAETLQKLANTTFMNTMDSTSFGLLFPIVHRAMRESSHEAKAKGVQLVGASVNLIADPEFLEPYVAELLPLLKECLLHPDPGIQREASKSFGSLALGLPALCEEDIYPYLMEKLQSQSVDADVSEVDRRGAAHGLAEVLLARRDLLPTTLYTEILPRISSGKTFETKAGGLALFQFLAHLGTQAFLPHLPRCLPVILDSLKEESEIVTKQALVTLQVLVTGYGGTYPRLLLPRLQASLFFEAEEAREHAMTVFFNFCEKLAESMKFGQDFLSMEILPTWYRQSLLASIFVARTDPSYSVRRQATLLWKERLQSGQKAKGEIMPVLQSVIKTLKAGDKTQIAAADACLAELKGDDVTVESLEDVELLAAPESGVNEGLIFAGPKELVGVAEESSETPAVPVQRGRLLAQRAGEEIAKADLPGPISGYIEAVVVSCLLETSTRAAAEAAAEAELAPLVPPKDIEASGSALAAFGLTQVLEKIFDGVADEASKSDLAGGANSDVLIRVSDLMLMYGGGHLLLKNTTLEMKKGRRYGVVGRNGAGKTTLMSTIASGGVNQIPKHIKILHVRPEVLVAASDLTAVQFCLKDCPDGSTEESLQGALQEVGFPAEMQAKSVNQLSGGWRMKLLLASAMMRECDILLLDEPTNHLDKASVEWLSQFLTSLKNSALMVISHDPHFLNAVCTDIIQYSSQKTLDYYEGNFDDFRRARQITSDEEAEALLLGNEVEVLGNATVEAADDDDVDPANGGISASLLDKSSKITFPIPGKVQGHSSNRPVMELKNVFFAYNEQDGPLILKDVSCKLNLSSRVGIIGENGAGKSTLLNLLCGELWPSPSPDGKLGEVAKNRNLRLAYIAQQHMYHLGDFMNSSACNYIQKRFKNGWDEALQERLTKPSSDEEAKLRKELAAKYGKYCNEVEDIVSRVVRGQEVFYEVQWKNLPDPKQNTMETIAKLKMMAVSSLAKAYDERLAAQSAGIDQRPLSQREIVKHLEQFGLDEELVLNRQIGGFSAGQKSKLTLGAAFWTKPHIVALDEPTNYIDMETLDSLAQALQRFKGGVVVISHSSDFVERVCAETWLVEDGQIKKEAKIEKKA